MDWQSPRAAALALAVAATCPASALAQSTTPAARLYLPSVSAWYGETDCQPFVMDPSLEAAAEAPEVRRRTRITPWGDDWRVYRMSPSWLIASTGSSLPLTSEPGAARTGSLALRFDGSRAQSTTFVTPRDVPVAFEPGEVRQAFFSFWYRLDISDGANQPRNAIEVHLHGLEDESPAWTQGDVLLGRLDPALIEPAPPGLWRLASYEISQYLEGYDLGMGRWNLIVPSLTSQESGGLVGAVWAVDDLRLNVCFNPRD